MKPKLLIIAGATATGKTDVALALARRFDGELVGADSVQVYRGFDIGSAKPRASELGGVAHHLIDIIDPDQRIDAAEYARQADAAIQAIQQRGRVPIVVGGTGLWLRALTRGLVDLPPVDAALRTRLEARAAQEGAAALHRRLGEIDPQAAAQIHPNDALRIVRALEVHTQTGQPLGELQAAHALGQPRYDSLFIALDQPRESLRERIARRVDAMIEAGWAEETRTLLQRWDRKVRAFGSVGYREMVEHVIDGVALEQTRERICVSTWKYAKRQRNWFRSEAGIQARPDAETVLSPPFVERIAQHLQP